MNEMNNLDLLGVLQRKLDELDISVKALRRTGTEYAQAERDYKIALRQTALKMRDDGMAIGLINLIVYGEPKVAELRFKRDVNDAIFKANLEAINASKLYINVLREQIEREWNHVSQ